MADAPAPMGTAGSRALPVPVPPPPPGPGVQPPFAAPPTEGTRQRRWWAVGLAAATVLVVCVGALAGTGAIVVLGTQVVRDESVTAVTHYLAAIQDRRFDTAYDLLCDAIQARTPRSRFIQAESREPAITAFTVGEAELTDKIRVPATIHYAGGVANVRYVMEQDPKTGAIEVCGQEY